MAEPLFIVRNAASQVVLDSRDAAGGCCVELAEIAAGAAPVFTYPDFVGRTALVFTADGLWSTGATVDTALGYPRVTFSAYVYVRTIAIFVV